MHWMNFRSLCAQVDVYERRGESSSLRPPAQAPASKFVHTYPMVINARGAIGLHEVSKRTPLTSIVTLHQDMLDA